MASDVLVVDDDPLQCRPVARAGRSRTGATGLRDSGMRSPAMERVTALGQRAASARLPVLIEGEAGVGKEMLARAIHDASRRRGRPFVALDSGAIPAGLLEALLVSSCEPVVRGPNRLDPFPEARGGTLFLDDIGALPAAAQERLVAILRSREPHRPLGGTPRQSDVQLIAATERRLVDLVSEGGFREDLFQL